MIRMVFCVRAAAAAPHAGGRYRAEGALTIKGRTVPIAPFVQISETGDEIVATGEARFHRSALGGGINSFSVEVGDKLSDKVGDEYLVDFRMVGRRAGRRAG